MARSAVRYVADVTLPLQHHPLRLEWTLPARAIYSTLKRAQAVFKPYPVPKYSLLLPVIMAEDECPLCCEPFELGDELFLPCDCGFKVRGRQSHFGMPCSAYVDVRCTLPPVLYCRYACFAGRKFVKLEMVSVLLAVLRTERSHASERHWTRSE